jgi:hypothetical protein
MDGRCREYEAISGEPECPARNIACAQSGSMVFVATVISRVRAKPVLFETSKLCIGTGRFVPLSPDRTRLLSEEVFRFKGLINKLLGYLAR